MTDSRVGKTYYLKWDEWKVFCYENMEDPYEKTELNFDLGGGNYYTVALRGCSHRRTVAINEEGNAGVFCADCGKQLEKEC